MTDSLSCVIGKSHKLDTSLIDYVKKQSSDLTKQDGKVVREALLEYEKERQMFIKQYDDDQSVIAINNKHFANVNEFISTHLIKGDAQLMRTTNSARNKYKYILELNSIMFKLFTYLLIVCCLKIFHKRVFPNLGNVYVMSVALLTIIFTVILGKRILELYSKDTRNHDKYVFQEISNSQNKSETQITDDLCKNNECCGDDLYYDKIKNKCEKTNRNNANVSNYFVGSISDILTGVTNII